MNTTNLSSFLLVFILLVSSCKDENKTIENAATEVEVTQAIANHKIIKVLGVAEFNDHLSTMEDIQLVDVRTPSEYAEGHLKNAINFSVTDVNFQTEIKGLDPEKPIYVYCRSGGRSARASEKLKQFGFVEIRDLNGGITAWQAAQLPIEK